MFKQIPGLPEVYGDGRGLLMCADASQPVPELAPYRGAVQAVYIDPPFMTGDKFTRKRRFGEKGWRTGSPAPDYPGYSDRFASREEYLTALKAILTAGRDLLSPTGVLMLHMDWHSVHHARLLCDEVFGEDRFVNEIIWAYESGGRAKKFYSRKHDNILMYSR